ncbi:LPXTG-motif cell wall anchor domain-containing protein [Actinokineospora terrae]|uniref:LPXTG-motif cell wall anchor domain-containing protein n=1 Tax=Actinokineospora terrae TaxID=155974 RepID=A0A1H9XCJ5_9PSEU|nr:LPXTG-motif cell wall anchor domain-containing protein [Actinokineospora terrae]
MYVSRTYRVFWEVRLLTFVKRAAVAIATGLTLVATALPALAQDDPDLSFPDYPMDEVVSPTPATVASICKKGVRSVEVAIHDSGPFTVRLVGSDLPAKTTKANDEPKVTFKPVPPGEYTVEIDGAGEASDGLPVVVRPCTEDTPSEDPLEVSVQCRGGWGIVTAKVTNPSTDEVREYAIDIDLPYTHSGEIAPGVAYTVVDNAYDDRDKYQIKLHGPGFDPPVIKTFSVNCRSGNAPGLGTYAQCDGKDNINSLPNLWVEIDNPNRISVDYTVSAHEATKTVTVPAVGHGSANLGPIEAGDYKVIVKGSDGTETVTGVSVDFCEDVKVDTDGLQISSRCVDEQSVVTFRYYAVGPYPAERKFTIDGKPGFEENVRFDGDGVYQWTRHVGVFADGGYTAHLTGSGLTTTETFKVDCERDETTTPTTQPSTPDTTTTAPPTSSTGTTPTGGSTTTSPAPQGGTAPNADGGSGDLPVTGAAVGGMVLLGLAALGGGAFLLIAQRRKRSGRQSA